MHATKQKENHTGRCRDRRGQPFEYPSQDDWNQHARHDGEVEGDIAISHCGNVRASGQDFVFSVAIWGRSPSLAIDNDG